LGGSTDTNGENAVKGMPHLYYVAGAGSRPTWVGRTPVIGEDPHDARRIYQREDALPLPPDPEPAGRAPRRFTLRRIFGATAG
jgi:hypothetical protein